MCLRLPHRKAKQYLNGDGLSMSDQQMAELYERLVAGKANNVTVERVFLRGWNAGIDYAIKQMRITCDEVIELQQAEEPAR